MQNHSLLDNVTIILVDTKSPANIGAVARSMMNMGLSRLVLVNPLKDRNEEAYKLAAGADRIIKEATIVETLADAIAGQNLVVGTSRHPGRLRKNIRPPREMAEQIVPLLSKNRVAVVFGNEVNGLDKRDLALCHEIIAIPSSEAFPSLNLSHAVMIVAYELFLAARTGVSSGDRELATADDLEQFHLH
ncbi:MAG TPA: RNA methyltransferase, partial [Nitrospirota bacterium]